MGKVAAIATSKWNSRQPKIISYKPHGQEGRPGCGFSMILEQPPHLARIYFADGPDHLVPMPWTYYAISYASPYEQKLPDGEFISGVASCYVTAMVCSPKRLNPKAMTHDTRVCAVPLPNMLGAGTIPCHNVYAWGPDESPLAETAAGRLAIASCAVANFHGQSSNTDGKVEATPNWRMIKGHLKIKDNYQKNHETFRRDKLNLRMEQMLRWAKMSIDESLALPWIYDVTLGQVGMVVQAPKVPRLPPAPRKLKAKKAKREKTPEEMTPEELSAYYAAEDAKRVAAMRNDPAPDPGFSAAWHARVQRDQGREEAIYFDDMFQNDNF